MAGQRIGAASPEGLAGLVGRWLGTGDPLVARAAVAGDPEAGLPRFLALTTDDPDVAWLVARNRAKNRLARLL